MSLQNPSLPFTYTKVSKMHAFNVNPLPGSFGVEVTNLDLASDNFSDEEFKKLLSVLYENRLVVIRDQNLTKAEYLAFGKRCGSPIRHVINQVRMSDFPDVLTITNTGAVDNKPRNGAAQWHTDQSYDAAPATSTMLYSIEAPEVGGETLFCDLMGAYNALPGETQTEIDSLEVEHLWGRGIAARPGDISPPTLSEEQLNNVPQIVHPLVKKHPVTGKKTLYSIAGTSRGIIGMPVDEARKLLLDLGDHAFQDRFVTEHKHRKNDIALWDTTSTMHTATPLKELPRPEDVRVLYRISVRGIPPVFQN